MRGHRTRTWIVGLAATAAGVLLLPGAASACLAPASAEVACAADLTHWEATVTITNEATVDYTLVQASLDVTRWATGARLTGFTAGATAAPGATIVGRATGMPLSTAGATITYTGRYADGRAETSSFTLTRPVASCDDTTTTTTAPTTTTTIGTTTVATTAETTTTTAATTTSSTATVPPTIGGSVFATTTTTAQVLGETLESTTTSQPVLAATGARSSGHLAAGALVLVFVGTALVLVVRRPAAA